MSLWLYKGKILANSDGTIVDDDECCCRNKSGSAVKCWFMYASYLQSGCDDGGNWSCKWTAPTLQTSRCNATNPFGYTPDVWYFQCGETSDASIRGTGYYVTSIVPEGNPTDCTGVTCTAPGFNGPIPEGDCPISGNPYFKLESYSGYADAGFTPERGELGWQLMLNGSPVENTAALDPQDNGYYYEYRMVKPLANQTDHDQALFADYPRFDDVDPFDGKSKQTSYQIDGAHWCNRNFSWKLTWADDDKLTFKSKSTLWDTWEFKDAELGDKGRVYHSVYSMKEGYYDAGSTNLENRYDVPEGTNYIKRNMCPTWSDDFLVYTMRADEALSDYWNNNYYTPFMEALSKNGTQWCVYSGYVTDATNAGDSSETKYTGYVIDMEATVKLWEDLYYSGTERYCPELQKSIPAQIEGIGFCRNTAKVTPFFRPTLKGVNFSWVAGTCNMRGWAIRESHLKKFSDQYQKGDCYNGHIFESYEDWNNKNYSPDLCSNTLVPTLYKTVSKFFAPSPSTNCTGQGTSLTKFTNLHRGKSNCIINDTSGFGPSNLAYAADVMMCSGLDTYALQLIYLSARNNFPHWYYDTDRTTQILPATMENPLQMSYTQSTDSGGNASCKCTSEWTGSATANYACSPNPESAISKMGCAVVFQVMYEWIPHNISFNVTDRDSTGWDEKDCWGGSGVSTEGELTVVRQADLNKETTEGSYYSSVQYWNYKSAQLSGVGWYCGAQGHNTNKDPTLSNTDYGLDQVDLSSVKDALKGFRGIFSCGASRNRYFNTAYIGTLVHQCYTVLVPQGCYESDTSIGGVDLITSMPVVKTKPTYTFSNTAISHGENTTASGGASIATIAQKCKEVVTVLQERADDPVIMGAQGVIRFSWLTRGNGISATDSGESTATGVSTTARCRKIIYEDITTSDGTIPLDSAEELDIIEAAEKHAIAMAFSSSSMENFYFKAGEAPDPDDLKEDYESAITVLETALKSCKVEP